MFTLFMELGGRASAAIKAGKAEYDARKGDVTIGQLSTVILKATADWKPTINGKGILTPALRASLANALAGLAYNIGAAESGRSLQ